MPTKGLDGRVDAPHESLRQELAELLEQNPKDLPDQAHLTEELGLDSLAMMRVLVWLEAKGVSIDSDMSRPIRVADVLSLAEAATSPVHSIQVSAHGADGLTGVTHLPEPPPPAVDPLAPMLSGHSLRLDPVTPSDADFLYALAAAPETGFRWRYRGVPPPFERFVEDMWKQVLVQHVVRRSENDEPVGHTVAYGADPTTRFAYVAAVFMPTHAGTGLAAHAVALFVRYLFHTLPLVKVYLEIPGYNWPQLRSGEGTLFQVEGVLRDHHFYADRTWHQYLCAIYRNPPLMTGRP